MSLRLLVCRFVMLAACLGSVVATAALPAVPSAGIKPADRVILVYGGQEKIRFDLGAQGAAVASVRWSMDDWLKKKRGGGELRPEKTSGRNVVAVPSPGTGWFRVRLEARDGAGVLLGADEFALTIGEPVKSDGRFFRYGVCTHLFRNTPEDLRRELDAASGLGIDMVRDSLDWNGIQPAAGQWRFEASDALLDELDARKIEQQWLLGFTARWATLGNPQGSHADWNKAAPKMEPWLEFVTTTVKRYQKRIRWWEIWNEPDIGFWNAPVADYVTLFDRTAAAIKAVDPTLQVMNGGFAMVKRKPNPEFIRDFLAAAETRNWDIRAYHDYMSFPDMIVRHREHEAAYQGHALAKAPVFVNEGGFHTLMPGGEPEQAITLAKKMAASPAFGFTGYLWYNLRDKGVDPTDKEHHFGLTGRDFQLKPAYAAYRQVIRELSGRKYLTSAQPIDGAMQMHLYAGSAAGEGNVLVLWNESRGFSQPMWIECPAGVSVVSATDLMGEPLAITGLDDGVLIEVTDRPVYLRLSGPAMLPVVQPILELPKTLALVAGRDVEAAVKVRNPLKRNLTPSIEWESDRAGLKITRRDKSGAVGPGAEAALTTVFSIDKADTSGALVGRITLGDAAQPFVFRLPYEGVRVVPRSESAPLVLELNKRDDVVNLFEALIRPEMNWRGTSDLSGSARLSASDEALVLDIRVTDDRHVQSHTDTDLWEQDSLQVGIALSGLPTDYSEVGFALTEKGELNGAVYQMAPRTTLRTSRVTRQTALAITREGTTTRYQVRLPWVALGLKQVPAEPFRVNFIVNDDDGDGRKQWLRLAPGMGDGKAPERFPLFLVEPAAR
ncbi:GH39 family glycosyl hydrolase [Rariglobus hedericola]|uniref:Uncharacterized protein n=1 Tax=Rariglobus hedericola TaxID=2597822 RepID=A0A556QSG3_9BACT|nr:sugar-binding protein [Rariglobus hedericola]TSJ79587.1 hypothetical protein FPL22_09965 [Rariglobus hedericola]